MGKLCINPRDIQTITGKSDRVSRNIYNDIKVFYKKEKHHEVTIDEMCTYLNIRKEDVIHLFK